MTSEAKYLDVKSAENLDVTSYTRKLNPVLGHATGGK